MTTSKYLNRTVTREMVSVLHRTSPRHPLSVPNEMHSPCQLVQEICTALEHWLKERKRKRESVCVCERGGE